MTKEIDVCVIGGGAGGMACALGAYENGAKSVLLIEKDIELGGILQQCIHNGFGLHMFKEELSGPAYAERFKNKIYNTPIEVKLDTMVIKVTEDKSIHYMNVLEGYQVVKAKAIVFSIGCRERTRHAIEIPGKRLAGILTAGTAQRYLNIEGFLVGKKVFILGSGDIGLIMARRMTLEGAEVVGVAELMPYSNGLNRNIVQCLDDFNIPLYLSHTVTNIRGKERVESVTIAQVDEHFNLIPNTEKDFDVNTLLLSVGLIPENSFLRKLNVDINPITNGAFVDDHYQTSIPGIFSCGNSLHVHDLVDYVSEEGYNAGISAANYVNNSIEIKGSINVSVGNNIRYVVPSVITNDGEDSVEVKFRVCKPIDNGKIIFKSNNEVIKEIRKQKLLPAEMENIKLNKSTLFNHTNSLNKELVIEIEF